MSKGSFLGEFEQLVLLAVTRLKSEGYGMSIRREIEARTSREVTIGAVYATLERLERKGHLRSWEGESTPTRGGRSRRHFGLTPAGAQALQTSHGILANMWDGLDPSSLGGA